jgi:predicted DNA-binding transcriptional regulator AlpA
MTKPENHRLFKPIEAAHFLGLSQSWLAKLRLSGDGPPYMKVGRRVRYSRADLLKWAQKSLRHSTSETACGTFEQKDSRP